jgi:uncharacterized protein YecT (DUF1311 family)
MILLVAALLAAQADPPIDCTDPQTQTAMNICSGQEFVRADAEMNRVWAEARAEMQRRDRTTATTQRDGRPSYSAALLESQRAWLRYRDAQCRVAGYGARGGSMEPLLVNSCRRALTEARTVALSALMEEGG